MLGFGALSIVKKIIMGGAGLIVKWSFSFFNRYAESDVLDRLAIDTLTDLSKNTKTVVDDNLCEMLQKKYDEKYKK